MKYNLVGNTGLLVSELCFGTMTFGGQNAGVWDNIGKLQQKEVNDIMKTVLDAGINFIDTANSYGPDVSEQLIREALHPYKGLLIATKAGLERPGPNNWTLNGRPDYLIDETRKSLKKLGVEQISLWQLHRIDPKVPAAEQFDAVKFLLDNKLIKHAGLSEVSVKDIEAASKVFDVATVQNRYNLADRGSEDVVNYCEKKGIGFIPWYPLASGDLAKPGSLLDQIATRHGAAPSQIALAWALKRSPVMLPIPGTSQMKHLEENVAAAEIVLSDSEFQELDRADRSRSSP